MKRAVTPELLDELPPGDRRAIDSRRDLQKVNAVMGHAGIMAGMLLDAFPLRPPETLVELGGGDGLQLLRLARLLAPRWKSVSAVLVDKHSLLTAANVARFAELGWRVDAVQQDVFEWMARQNAQTSDVLLANLFLHHFRQDDLARLLQYSARQSNFFLACEPRRAGLAFAAASLLWFIGCNDVTRNDARISVQAGFAGRELSQSWPHQDGWTVTERKAGLFTHCFAATRTPLPPRERKNEEGAPATPPKESRLGA